MDRKPHDPEAATRPTADLRGGPIVLCGLVLLGVTMACSGAATERRAKPAVGPPAEKRTKPAAGEVAEDHATPVAGAPAEKYARPAVDAPAGQLGKATYYSPRLAGRKTASGEPYDPAKLTAAHPTLRLGTRVRVTRLDGGARSVVVRINDRCAGVKKIIDLSEAAARRLDMMRAGIVPVRVVPIDAN